MKKWIGIYSILFAIAAYITYQLDQASAETYYSLQLSGGGIYSILLIGIATFIFIALLIKSAVILHKRIPLAQASIFEGKRILVVWAIIFLGWLPCLIAFLPGMGMDVDTTVILRNGIIAWRQHPVIYCFIVQVLAIVGQLLGDINYGILLYSLLQMILLSGTCTYAVWWLYKRKCPDALLILLIVYFVSSFVIADYSITMLKDTMFSATLLFWSFLVYDIIDTDGAILGSFSYRCFYLFIALSCIVLRNNGIYVCIVVGLCLYTIVGKWRKKLLILTVIAALLGSAPNACLKIITGRKPLFQEAVAIPLQQIARVAAVDGKITEKQRLFLEKLFPVESMKEKYDPRRADNVKWDGGFQREWLDDNRGEFIKIWAGMLKSNLPIYIDAYINQTYGLWTVHPRIAPADIYYTIESEDIHGLHVLPPDWENGLQTLYQQNAKFLDTGICIWIVLLLGIIIRINKGNRYALVILPVVIVWLTLMVSVPAMNFRYVFWYPLALPVILLMAICPLRKLDTGERVS